MESTTTLPPIRSLVVPIAREICPLLIQREYSSLDTISDAEAIIEVCRIANIVRYLRMGGTAKWSSADELALCRKLADMSEAMP
jgi:hypothetical protein